MSEPRRSSRVATRSTTTSSTPSATTVVSTASKPASRPASVTKKRSSPSSKTTAVPDTKKAKPSSGLAIGSPLPSLTLSTTSSSSSSSPLSTSTLRKAVLFTYPRANTSGCTTQAKCYRDSYSTYQQQGYEVYGLGNDGIQALNNWKDKQKLGYTLISDPKRQLIEALTGSADKTR